MFSLPPPPFSPEPSVRAELMEQVPHVAMFCQEFRGQLRSPVVPGHLLPMVVKFLTDSNNQVRKTSQAALLVLLEQGLVERSDVQDQVCPVIIRLTEADSLDDYRTEAVAVSENNSFHNFHLQLFRERVNTEKKFKEESKKTYTNHGLAAYPLKDMGSEMFEIHVATSHYFVFRRVASPSSSDNVDVAPQEERCPALSLFVKKKDFFSLYVDIDFLRSFLQNPTPNNQRLLSMYAATCTEKQDQLASYLVFSLHNLASSWRQGWMS